jgi:GNAT superfamily N-acetyltransferase
MSPSPSFKIRPATLASSDDSLLVDFQESQIPWLSTIGSSSQWGTQPIREVNPGAVDRTRSWIERSEKATPWRKEWCRAFIAEADDETPGAGLVLDCEAPEYVRSVLPEQAEDGEDEFVYLAYLISNRQAGEKGRGSGKALIEFAKEEVRKMGLKRICLDCWRGNERKLVK